MERNKIIDIAKGIGIILVVYTHTKCYAHDSIYIFIMPLFFALSGYFFNEQRKLGDNIKNKFKTLIIPYIFYFLLVQILFIIVHKFFYKDAYFGWTMFLKPWGPVGPLWFFYGLFWTSILFSIVHYIFKNKYVLAIVCLSFGVIGYLLSQYHIAIPISTLVKNGIKIPLYIDSSMSMMPFYYFGFFLNKSNFVQRLDDKKTSFILAAACLGIYILGIISGLVNNTKPNEVPQNYILFLFAACSAIILMLILSNWISKLRFAANVFSLYGKQSLIIFVFHFCTFYLYYLIFKTSFSQLSYLDGFFITIFALILSMIIGLLQLKYLPIPNLKEAYSYLKEKLSYLKK